MENDGIAGINLPIFKGDFVDPVPLVFCMFTPWGHGDIMGLLKVIFPQRQSQVMDVHYLGNLWPWEKSAKSKATNCNSQHLSMDVI